MKARAKGKYTGNRMMSQEIKRVIRIAKTEIVNQQVFMAITKGTKVVNISGHNVHCLL